jgi:hypothetical protein
MLQENILCPHIIAADLQQLAAVDTMIALSRKAIPQYSKHIFYPHDYADIISVHDM